MKTLIGTLGAKERVIKESEVLGPFRSAICVSLVTVFVMSFAAYAKPDAKLFKSGGDGSGGGNTATTSYLQIQTHLAELKSRMLTILYRVHAWDKERNSAGMFVDEDVESFFAESSLVNTIQKMNIQAQEAPCKDPDNADHADYKGYGKVKTQTVCMSTGELVRLPPESYAMQIDALGFHEVSHLLGRNERAAQSIQNFLLAQPWIMDLSGDRLKPMLSAYDMVIAHLGKITFSVATQTRVQYCREVSAWEQRLVFLDQALDVPPGSNFRVSMVPRDLKYNRADNEVLATLNWGNDACIDEALTTKERVTALTNAKNVYKYLVTKRAKLAQYVSLENKKLAYPTLMGVDEAMAIPNYIAQLNRGANPARDGLDPNLVNCKLTELNSGRDVSLDRTFFKLEGHIQDQNGVQRVLAINSHPNGVAFVRTDHAKSTLHIISGSKELQLVTYFGTIFGAFLPLAEVDGYRSFNMDFYIADNGMDLKSVKVQNPYRLSCHTH